MLKKHKPLKIGLEYMVMGVLAAGALIIFKKEKKDRRDFYLAAALLTGVAGEVTFTMYSSTYDGIQPAGARL
ncbi:MAG: MASE3 domain-containing protein [Bacillota bacterium]